MYKRQILNYAAYFAEIYRGGIESMDPGQYEAAQILGYNKVQTFLRIILPQVMKQMCIRDRYTVEATSPPSIL